MKNYTGINPCNLTEDSSTVTVFEHRKVIKDLVAASPNRRGFLQKLGLATAAAGGVAATSGMTQAQTSFTDVDILNFALNLEYLEAEFYTVVTTGQYLSQTGIDITGSGVSGPTTGGSKVAFTNPSYQAVAMELANDERTHVNLIKSTMISLGAQPIAKPAINLGALGFGFASQNDYLVLARIFEDIGVTAYGGAAPLIKSSVILGYAARILATEAMHAGNIRLQIANANIATTALDAADHVPPPSGSEYFNLDSNAITEVRSPGQVLYLAFGAANASSGGFFPGGVNGFFTTSSAMPAASDGISLTANPNPIMRSSSVGAMTTISWNAPGASVIEIHIGSPAGQLFVMSGNSGSAPTGAWVVDGMTFYLQDVSGGKPLVAANTLATLKVTVK